MAGSAGSLAKPSVVTVAATAGGTVIVAANGNRLAAIIRNVGDSTGQAVFLGGGVGNEPTTVNGTPLENGASAGRRGDTITITGTAEIRGIVAAGTQAVSVLELAD